MSDQPKFPSGYGIYDSGVVATMTDDAPDTKTTTHLRDKWNALHAIRRAAIREKVGELLTEYRYCGGVSAEAQIERVLEAVLDG